MAGLLGDIFSTVDTAKRKLTDLLGNPVLSAQQIIGNMNDRARVLNQLTAGAAQERDIYGPKSQQLANMIADAYNPMGMMVYHGSPAKFSRFDPTKIGSGEGAQSYGYGHYVAQSPAVARDYQRRLAKEAQATDLNTRMQMVDVGGKPLTAFNVDMDAALIDAAKAGKKDFVNLAQNKKARWDQLAKDKTYQFQDYAKQKASAYQNLIDTAKKSDVDYTGTGMFYEIDLPDEQIARMLDWDKPLSKQPENVQAALEKLGYKVDRADVDKYSDALLDALMTDAKTNLPKQPLDMAGEALYRKLGNPEQAAQRLREAGIPGIRYLDQGSRGVGQGTSNFVVFPGNEDLLRILKRNEDPLGLLAP